MRTVIALLVATAACSSQRSAPEEETGPFDPADAVTRTDDATTVTVHRKDVPLAEMPIVAATLGGLPMTGMANVAIDLVVPKVEGRVRYRQANGVIAVSCPAGCALGDGRTRLLFPGLGGVDFGTVKFDSFDLRAEAHAGAVDVTKWELASKDLKLQARLHIQLDDDLDSSKLDGCLWFKETPELIAREPKTAAVIQTTGASRNRDGMFSIKIGGTIGQRKMLAQECGAI